MNRRACLKAVVAGAGAVAVHGAGARPIELHVDLAVDPAREAEMLQFFETSFRPAASKQPGYIELKMLKLTSTLRGPAPEGANFRFVLEFKKRRVAAEMGGIGHSPEAVAEYRGHAYQQKLYSIVV